MKILLVTPSFLPAIGGNARTVARWAGGLSGRDVDVAVADMSADPQGRRLSDLLADFRPDLVHAHHAWKAGRWLKATAGMADIPWVISFAGTDLLALEARGAGAASIRAIASRAARLLAPGRETERRVRALFPDLAGRIVPLPKGVSLDDESYPLRAELGFGPGDTVFLLPAGIRRVKNQLLAVRAFARIRAEVPGARLVLAGPVIDPDYAAAVEQEADPLGVRRVEIPPAQMAGAYREADVVLNVSEAEGFANALVEAMSAGRAVLASRIGPNAEAVEDGKTGLLFAPGDELDLARQAVRLARDPDLRRRLGEAARAAVAARYDPGAEIDALLGAYAGALAERRP